jgi:O-Antigen ligase
MRFALLIIVFAVLFIRPSEIIPDVAGEPIYQAAIVACLAVSFPRVLLQFTPTSLGQRPITTCVLGVWLAAILSHMAQQNLSQTSLVAQEFGKVVLFFLLLVGVVDSYERLRRLALCMSGLITIAAGIAVLQYHGELDLPGLRTHFELVLNPTTGDEISTGRLCGSGIFNDPNDFSIALTLCILLSLYAWSSVRGTCRHLWTIPIALSSYALVLTQSRGGLLALAVGLFILAWGRFGWRKSLACALLIALPFLALEARQLDFDLSNPKGTGQARIQLWAEGLSMLRESPVIGIGAGNFEERVGLVAHNSFVHAFAELGLVGGSLFLGAFVYAISVLRGLRHARGMRRPSDFDRLRHYLIAAIAGTAAALFTLSRVYTYPVYVVLGLVSVYLNFAAKYAAAYVPPVSFKLIVRCGLLGVSFLLATHIFILITARWQ